jgi:ATP-dependent DNA helicase RecQ
VRLALRYHFDSIPNSIVKRSCGDDTSRVADWDNSSVPSFLISALKMNSQTQLLIRQLLWEFWHFNYFRSSQKEIIDSIVDGKDVLVLMPTGGGKSLCFQLPALVNSGLTLVISPLVALMENQVGDLQKRGITAELLHSELSKEKRQQVLGKIDRQELKLLYLSPETLLSPPVWNRLAAKDMKIDSLVIDEVHCLVQWGETFRPSYRRLGAVRQSLLRLKPQETRINIAAFTATADRQAQQVIVNVLQLKEPQVFSVSPYRPNLNLQVQTIWTSKGKRDRLLKFLRGRDGESGIIYVRSRRDVESISSWLLSLNYVNAAYHAGLTSEERRKIEVDWLNDRIQFVVSTSAFGMGVNKADVRWVVHYQIPQLLSEYLQEIGRGGRDGLAADALALVSEPTGLLNPEDKQRQKFFQETTLRQYRKVKQIFHKLPIAANVNDLKRDFPDAEMMLGILHGIGCLEWQDIYSYRRSPSVLDVEFDRLQQFQRQLSRRMSEYLMSRECRWKYLLDAFSFEEKGQNFSCGHCDRCQRSKLGKIC